VVPNGQADGRYRPPVETDQAGRGRNFDRFMRGYRVLTYVLVAVGAITAVFLFATGDAVLGWFFVILTALLLPAYKAGVLAARRARDR
jgi:hypothetical protein